MSARRTFVGIGSFLFCHTLSFRNDPELCDVVRASESVAASVCSETVRPVSTTPTRLSPSPNSPSRGSEIVEMKAVDNSAALPPIPNTPVDKL